MFGFLKRQSHLIGVDLGNDCVKLAQLANGAQDTLAYLGGSGSWPIVDDVRNNARRNTGENFPVKGL